MLKITVTILDVRICLDLIDLTLTDLIGQLEMPLTVL